MTVYGHFEGKQGSLKAGIPSMPRYIACHYKNENGEICRQEFNFQNWDGLRLQIEKEIENESKT